MNLLILFVILSVQTIAQQGVIAGKPKAKTSKIVKAKTSSVDTNVNEKPNTLLTPNSVESGVDITAATAQREKELAVGAAMLADEGKLRVLEELPNPKPLVNIKRVQDSVLSAE